MSQQAKNQVVPLKPRRELRTDFTAHTLRSAVRAKRRIARKQKLLIPIKEIQMKKLHVLRTMPGIAAIVAVIVTTGVGAYALNNWFGGSAPVKQTNSVLSVDLSACQGNLPAGVSDTTDRHNVQFKVLGDPHISASDLQTKLLEDCEFSAVQSFYHGKLAANSALLAGKVKAVDGQYITLEYPLAQGTASKVFWLVSGATIYNQGQLTTSGTLKVGDPVMFEVVYPTDYVAHEGQDGLATISQVRSVFKTTYNMLDAPSASKSGFLYDKANIMPLEQYNQLKK